MAYLAWTPGSGTTNGIQFQVGNTTDTVSHNTFTINFNQNFSESPFQFARMQTANGPDTALMKIIQAGTTGMEIMIEEETSRDAETNHTKDRNWWIPGSASRVNYSLLYWMDSCRES